MPAAKANVLFLCTGNSARSQMGEALLRHHTGDRFQVFSAGLEAKGIHPYTIQVMNERGIDIQQQWSKSVETYIGQSLDFRYLITVCGHADATCPQALWARAETRLHWPFDDPAAIQGSDTEKLAAFRRVRDQIESQIQVWLREQGGRPL